MGNNWAKEAEAGGAHGFDGASRPRVVVAPVSRRHARALSLSLALALSDDGAAAGLSARRDAADAAGPRRRPARRRARPRLAIRGAAPRLDPEAFQNYHHRS